MKISFKQLAIVLLFWFLSFSTIFAQNLKIDIHLQGLSDTIVILGHHFNKSMYPDDTIMVNSKGMGSFKSESKLNGGLYFIYVPAKNAMADFLLGSEDQTFSITANVNDISTTAEFKGCKINEAFSAYQKFLILKKNEAEPYTIQLKEAQSAEEKEKVRKKLDAVSEEVKNYQDNLVEENKDNFLSAFILATKEVVVPDPPVNENGEVLDSNFQYHYYRDHYFDHFDLSDPRLLYTPFYEQKLITFLDKVIPQIPDTIIHYTDKFIQLSRTNDELFRYMLITLFNHYAKSKFMGHDAIYIHIADKYYIDEAHWSDSAFIADLKERVKVNKPLLIGKIAPDIQIVRIETEHFIQAMSDTAAKADPYVGNFIRLHDINARYIVLAFWEADCGHCKKEIPALYKIYTESLKDYGVEIVAIHTLGGVEGKEKWIDFVNKNKLYDWINCWNPYDFNYKKIYDVKTTPRIFLLDKDKRIIAKRLGSEQVLDIIQFESKKN